MPRPTLNKMQKEYGLTVGWRELPQKRLAECLAECPEEDRVYYCIILQAFADLDSKRSHIKKSAQRFLSGADGALSDICHCLELNPQPITKCYKEMNKE